MPSPCGGDSPRSNLLFPSSAVHVFSSSRHPTPEKLAFSSFRGACLLFNPATHPGVTCFFLLPRCIAAKTTHSSSFPLLRCFFSFLPALKATYFSLFPATGCLSPLYSAAKATNLSSFPLLRCFSSFLPALKATYFSIFPSAGCLSPKPLASSSTGTSSSHVKS